MLLDDQRRARRRIALGASASMTAFALVGASPAAHPATGLVGYTCSFGSAVDVDVNTDSDAPARIHVGDAVTPTVTSVVTIPDSVRGSAIPSDARWVDGTVTAGGDVNGTAVPPFTMAIARTPVPLTGALPLTAVGTSAPLPATAPGDLAIHAGDFSVTMQFYDHGDATTGEPVTTTCTRPPGQPPTIDSVVVAARSATALTLAKSTTAYGEDLTASAKVTTTGGSPDGDVAFVVDGLATKARVDKDGVATTTVRGLRTGAHSVSAVFVARDSVHYDGSSTGSQPLTVTKASTRTALGITGKRTSRPTRVTARVKSAFGTTATGRVRFKVVRSGTRQRWVKVKVLDDGQRTVGFGRLEKGRYKVTATYRGDGSHVRSRAVKGFRVRRG